MSNEVILSRYVELLRAVADLPTPDLERLGPLLKTYTSLGGLAQVLIELGELERQGVAAAIRARCDNPLAVGFAAGVELDPGLARMVGAPRAIN